MTKYIPTDEQRAAYNVDHGTRATAESIVRMIATGRGIDRALVRRYVSHDVDTTGLFDTVAVFFVDLFANGEKVRGYAEFAFNVVNGVPIAADFRDFRATITA
jgi:hypothetical protein